MTTTMKDSYDTLIKQFVHDNMSIMQASRLYKEPTKGREESGLNYIPDHNQTADPDYIGDTPQFKVLLNTFLDTFINRADITFKMQGHMPGLDGQSIYHVMATVPLYSRENLLYEYEFKLQVDIWSAFLSIRDNTKVHYFVFSYGDNKIELQSPIRCQACNEYMAMVIDYTKNAVVSLITKKDCPLANEPKNIVVNLESPSGKLVFLNDPRDFLNIERPNRYEVSINSTLGCIQETQFYAERNVGFFFIGNCMPYIFQKGNKILFMAYNDEADDLVEKVKGYEECGSVCADLWWYTILDHQLFLDLCAEKQVDPKSIEHTVVTTNKKTFTVDHDLTAHKEGYFRGTFSTITY